MSIYEDFKEYEAGHDGECSITRLELDEETSAFEEKKVGLYDIDLVYTMMHQHALQCFCLFLDKNPWVKEENSSTSVCLDVGSSTSFVYMMASFVNFLAIDASRVCHHKDHHKFYVDGTQLMFHEGEAQQLPIPNGKMAWVSSLHAIEHFGLGRYRDTIDPLGDIKGIREIHRVLCDGGTFVGAVPILPRGMDKVVFNRSRYYSVDTIKSMLRDAGFDIWHERCLIAPSTLDDGTSTRFPTIATPATYEELFGSGTGVRPDAVYLWVATAQTQETQETEE